MGKLRSHTGKPLEAEAELHKAMAIQQKLADDNPAVIGFRLFLAFGHIEARQPAFGHGQAGGGGGPIPQGAGDSPEAGR